MEMVSMKKKGWLYEVKSKPSILASGKGTERGDGERFVTRYKTTAR